MSEEITTMSVTVTTELKKLLERWSKEDDLSMSQIVRQILRREAQRREQSKEQKIKH